MSSAFSKRLAKTPSPQWPCGWVIIGLHPLLLSQFIADGYLPIHYVSLNRYDGTCRKIWRRDWI